MVSNLFTYAPSTWRIDDSLSVLYQCALEQDLKLFEAGDNTEVGERGLTLR